MENKKIETFQWEDIDQLVEMVCDLWHLERMFGSQKKGREFSQLYLYDVLSHTTKAYVIKDGTCIIGFLALSIAHHQVMQVPDTYQDVLNHIEPNTYQKYLKRLQDYHKNCAYLLAKTHQQFDGEIILFIVSSAYQNQGIGTALLQWAKTLFQQEHCRHYCLYTDTSCRYSFYDHYGMTQRAAFQPDSQENFRMFLYSQCIENDDEKSSDL